MRFEAIVSRCVCIPAANIDTDQIIPARFLRGVDCHGLGEHLFDGLRRRRDGTPDPYFPLNRADARGARILVAGRNFGCGSSREHAVWALMDWGIRAVIAPTFADIFRANALKKGLLPVALAEADWIRLLQSAEASQPVRVDLNAETVHVAGHPAMAFAVDPFARRCLLEGMDELGYLLGHLSAIEAFEQGRP